MTTHRSTTNHNWPARIRVLFLSWFGCGLAGKAPGTLGSLGALPIAALLTWAWGSTSLIPAAVLVFLVGWVVTAAHLKDDDETKDPQWIVIDEVAGQWATLAAAPLHPVWYLIGFLLFRVFDILKPWPVSWADKKIPGALGIMLDDMLAALYAALSLIALQFLWPYIV